MDGAIRCGCDFVSEYSPMTLILELPSIGEESLIFEATDWYSFSDIFFTCCSSRVLNLLLLSA